MLKMLLGGNKRHDTYYNFPCISKAYTHRQARENLSRTLLGFPAESSVEPLHGKANKGFSNADQRCFQMAPVPYVAIGASLNFNNLRSVA